jgi:hypothetical protein
MVNIGQLVREGHGPEGGGPPEGRGVRFAYIDQSQVLHPLHLQARTGGRCRSPTPRECKPGGAWPPRKGRAA